MIYEMSVWANFCFEFVRYLCWYSVPCYLCSGSQEKSRSRSREREKAKEREKERDLEKERERDREREKEKAKEVEKDKSLKEKERASGDKDKGIRKSRPHSPLSDGMIENRKTLCYIDQCSLHYTILQFSKVNADFFISSVYLVHWRLSC